MPKFISWLSIHSIIKIDSAKTKDIPQSNKFAGMVVVFTGIRNNEMEKTISSNGGVIGSSITGKTTLLVAKNIDEKSSKLQKAQELGIQIMNYNDFAKQYNFTI